MNTRKKLAALEDILELSPGALKPETRLEDVKEWDSLTRLSFVVLLDDEFRFSRHINGQHIRGARTVQDLLNIMDAGMDAEKVSL